MKKILILTLLIFVIPNVSYGVEEATQDQLEALNLGSFITEGEKYTEEVFPNINIQELITKGITGQINNSILYKAVLNLLRRRDCFRNYNAWQYFSYNYYT